MTLCDRHDGTVHDVRGQFPNVLDAALGDTMHESRSGAPYGPFPGAVEQWH
jgi:hypothetical protein